MGALCVIGSTDLSVKMSVAPGVMTVFALSRKAAGSPLFCDAKKMFSFVKVSAEMKARSTTNKAATMARNESKDFMAINEQVTSPRDAPNRSRLSILFELTQVGISVLGSRLGM